MAKYAKFVAYCCVSLLSLLNPVEAQNWSSHIQLISGRRGNSLMAGDSR
jgi:hypothetical protein